MRHKRHAENSGESRSKRVDYCEKGSMGEKNDFSQATIYAGEFNYQCLRGKPCRPKHNRNENMVDMLHRTFRLPALVFAQRSKQGHKPQKLRI